MFRSNGSLYAHALGAQFSRLEPVLQRYFGPIPPGFVGRGRGTFSFVGSSRPRLLHLPLVLLARHRILFPERGRDIPFCVENRATSEGGLRGVRRFHFATRSRIMQDVMRVGSDRVIVERLGRRGELEVSLAASVVGGGMRLRSQSLALRLRRTRIPLPHLIRVVVSEDVDPADPDGQLVDVRLTAVMLGEVFRYTGSFHYRIEHDDGQCLPGVGAPL